MTDKILIIEDEQDIAELIAVHVQELGLTPSICLSGKKGLELALSQGFQLIILDVMLPDLSGLDICRQLRESSPLQAIIMLTSRSSETDRVLGLELGADDYLTKPFSVRELQARIRVQLRRVHSLQGIAKTKTPDAVTCVGELMVDHQCHKVTYCDSAIELTSTEFELLSFLGKHPDQVFSRSQLLDSVWGYHHSGYEHTVNSHINRLRNKLEKDVTQPQIIQTVWGVGYKLNSAGVHR
ncbi:response regulator transcription factor [Thalassotalea sp. M1531]|uniref:Phosphate regulon transcriptional regulatory protein PhoB n=1 Tax=Thalassotalea algicola TaxID=2716224 RepID=A0A7Y0Q5D5_9GAMM|nr:response regulator transcription factor [Thalassotalea algicola]NMP30198.1 response regulator transcription factor [Thalassotalea algicola]